MSGIGQWLIDKGGVWGLIALILGATVLYLENKAKLAEAARVAELEKQCSELKSELKAEHLQRLADLRAMTDALQKQAEEYIEAMKAVGRWARK